MRTMWRLQFGLRTLLLVMLALGIAPWIVSQFVQWRQDRLWKALEAGKQQRDEALVQWRRTYESLQKGAASSSDEADARKQYLAARKATEDALAEILSYYGDTDEAQKRAIEWRESRRKQISNARGAIRRADIPPFP